ncbi:MAG: TolC family protein, partial [Pseudomonadota bacterium]
GDWISAFNDPIMTELVKDALKENPTLIAQAAVARSVRQQARATYGNSLPSLTASGTTGYNRVVTEDLSGDAQGFEDPVFGLALDASWDPDLWGRIDAGIEAARADLLASETDLLAAQLSIAAQTANGWINLNAALAQERVAVETFSARERTVTLTERRFARGLSTALDVRLARSSRAGAEADIALRRRISGEAARLLETLLGRYPSNEIEAAAQIPMLDPLLIGGNPTVLLARRPDIAAAEARVSAAGLRAEQARLALLPSLQLTATLSTSDDEFANAFDPSYIAGRAIASLIQPVFNGGALDAQRESALALAEQAVANSATIALRAWREEEDAIAADSLLAQQEDAPVGAPDQFKGLKSGQGARSSQGH